MHAIPVLQCVILFLLLKCTEPGQQPGMRTVPLLLLQWTERGDWSGLHAVGLLLLHFPFFPDSGRSNVNLSAEDKAPLHADCAKRTSYRIPCKLGSLAKLLPTITDHPKGTEPISNRTLGAIGNWSKGNRAKTTRQLKQAKDVLLHTIWQGANSVTWYRVSRGQTVYMVS